MFNSPILDVAIGLTLVFLLYSLLATSINEAIATLFSLRARMLMKGIKESMLSNTPDYGRYRSFAKGILSFVVESIQLFIPSGLGKIMDRWLNNSNQKLGEAFYNHPIIKNYGSNKIFSTPSYISNSNFSTVFIDTLLNDCKNNIENIIKNKLGINATEDEIKLAIQNLLNNTDTVKLDELFKYYSHCLSETKFDTILPHGDTIKILLLYWKNSAGNIEQFKTEMENWFDDSMNRVSGWYKRQAQFVLFLIGIGLAITFNVDTLEIYNTLSQDKNEREKIVALAEKVANEYKDDPRVKSKTFNNRLVDST
ncbi:MAG: hypothetical protein RI955_1902, partial [Bacteroidota bacterium]